MIDIDLLLAWGAAFKKVSAGKLFLVKDNHVLFIINW